MTSGRLALLASQERLGPVPRSRDRGQPARSRVRRNQRRHEHGRRAALVTVSGPSVLIAPLEPFSRREVERPRSAAPGIAQLFGPAWPARPAPAEPWPDPCGPARSPTSPRASLEQRDRGRDFQAVADPGGRFRLDGLINEADQLDFLCAYRARLPWPRPRPQHGGHRNTARTGRSAEHRGGCPDPAHGQPGASGARQEVRVNFEVRELYVAGAVPRGRHSGQYHPA